MLDLCCGAGQLAVHFLDHGYAVTGIDLSEPMLAYARQNAAEYLESGQAKFIHGDAGDFALDDRYGLVLSTYDSLNHLESEEALFSCFRCVDAVADGYFIFDLNTRKGLSHWNGVRVDDSNKGALIINRGRFDGKSDRAEMAITVFARGSTGLYRRIDETVYNTAFDLARVRDGLVAAGWKQVYFARPGELSTPVEQPEEEGRVFVIAGR